MKRILYLGYYLKQLDKNLYAKFSTFIQEKKGISAFSIPFRIIYNSLKYNISILEYFQFRFFEKSDAEKHREYACSMQSNKNIEDASQ